VAEDTEARIRSRVVCGVAMRVVACDETAKLEVELGPRGFRVPEPSITC
jgi:hypothetical protein